MFLIIIAGTLVTKDGLILTTLLIFNRLQFYITPHLFNQHQCKINPLRKKIIKSKIILLINLT